MNNKSELIEAVKPIVRRASEAILEIYEQDFDVEYKDDPENSPLTEADRTSHKIIVSELQKVTPEIPIISEESSKNMEYEERRGFTRFWLVDPLDGTKEFIKKNGEFTVNVGLIEENKPVAGVVMVPTYNTLYSAFDNTAQIEKNDEVSELSVSEVQTPDQATAVCSRSHSGPRIQQLFEELNITDKQKRGSSLKFCQVAEGKADIYGRYGPTWEWDTAAADAVVRCAGGTVTEPDGTPLVYNKESLKNLNGLLVTNGKLHRQVSEVMGNIPEA